MRPEEESSNYSVQRTGPCAAADAICWVVLLACALVVGTRIAEVNTSVSDRLYGIPRMGNAGYERLQ